VPPGWYYLPQQTYSTYGFYNPASVVIAPGIARRDLITAIDTTQAYMPPEELPAVIEEQPLPPPRPMPQAPPQETSVETKTEVVETLTRERKQGDRYAGPVLVTQTIHFDYDSYAIKPESFSALDAIGDALVNPPLEKAVINIEGHTDSDGTNEYNQVLSERRAWSVKSYLVQKFGIDPNRLIIVGYGEESPIAGNDTDEGKARNRRVEFENVSDLYQNTEQAAAAANTTDAGGATKSY
jgi:outer membrane protein OmpA-like peptidoglycan-associated protein